MIVHPLAKPTAEVRAYPRVAPIPPRLVKAEVAVAVVLAAWRVVN
jgi:hypothetical protein